MFIPGIFIWGDVVGDGAGIGMLCISGVGEGDGEGICFDGMPCIEGVGVGDARGVGVGEGIGIPCRCCVCTDVNNTDPSSAVSTIRVSGWVIRSRRRLSN